MFGFEQFEGGGGWRETNLFRFSGLAQVIPASWDWQKKSKNRSSLLVEFLFLPCPIRIANALVPMSLDPCLCHQSVIEVKVLNFVNFVNSV
jgi:hypothetical protein